MKCIFSLVEILTKLRRFGLQWKNLEKHIFVSKIWLNDPRVSCKEACSLVDLIEREKELWGGIGGIWRRMWFREETQNCES